MDNFPYIDEAELRTHKAIFLAQNSFAAASQTQELLDFLNLKIQVGILGERRAGVTVLIEALLSKPRPVTNLTAYFREAQRLTQSAEVHVHPTFPHLVLHDLPGFEATENPAAYLKKLGDLQQFSCFVIVVGTGGLRDVHLQVLKAIKQKKKAVFVVRTKIDLDLHTARRCLQCRHNSAQQMNQIRKALTETLAKDGLETKEIFLVSGLQTERYDFAWFEDTLEREALNLKRHHEGNLKDIHAVSQKLVQNLFEISKFRTLAEVPEIIQTTLANPTQIHLNVALIGETGSGNSSLINALRRVGSEEIGAAPTGVAETTKTATAYPFPSVPNMFLWDLPGVGLTEDDVKGLDLSRYSAFLLVASERYKHIHSCLAKTIASEGKEFFFVRNKIDVDVESQPDVKEKRQEQIRKNCVEALKNDGVNCPVFLVSSFMAEAYDLPLLREELQKRAFELKRKALRGAILRVVFQLVRLKSKKLMKDVWQKTLQVGLSAVDNLNETVANQLLDIIASFCIELGLNQASVANTARCTGKAARRLQEGIQSRFARPMQPAEVLPLIVKSPSWSSWAWSYVPSWGQGTKVEEAMISVENIYNLLKQAVVELSEDAERVLLAAFSED
ncbi:interferon-gamma-inducible GTPase 10-like [Erythrolamprus reginae]|uniref:interferon-gamma-inducible GTPase 10-like n=1 Tax=Erythrolamprus reginae TaxID=121349 RepID=UPI00396CB83D